MTEFIQSASAWGLHAAVAGVLSAVRRELELAPTQSDDTLVKRAAYHYRQELPERTCQVYRDRAPG